MCLVMKVIYRRISVVARCRLNSATRSHVPTGLWSACTRTQWRCDVTMGRPCALQTRLVGWTGDIIEWNSNFISLSPLFSSCYLFSLSHLLTSLFFHVSSPTFTPLSFSSSRILPLLLLFLCFPLSSVLTRVFMRPVPDGDTDLCCCLCVLIFTGRRLRPGSAGSSFAASRHARHGPPDAGRHYGTPSASACCNQKSVRYAAPTVGVVSLGWARNPLQSPLRHGAVHSSVLAAAPGSCPVTV